jgi:hypothetical protein
MDRCPHCQVDLDDDGTAVRCWRCGWEVRDVDSPREYHDRADEIADRNAFIERRR